MDRFRRRYEVERFRKAELLRLQSSSQPKLYRQVKKNYTRTEPYIHLTLEERRKVVLELARAISRWGFARLFAECIDKSHFDPRRTRRSPDEQALEQVISRFERYLKNIDDGKGQKPYGILIHDNNETVARRHTDLVKSFHKAGATAWTGIEHIIETPLFVNSELTSMVQIADLCSFGLRRYLENNETPLFDLIFRRADKAGAATVGVRHFTHAACQCKICTAHKFASIPPSSSGRIDASTTE